MARLHSRELLPNNGSLFSQGTGTERGRQVSATRTSLSANRQNTLRPGGGAWLRKSHTSIRNRIEPTYFGVSRFKRVPTDSHHIICDKSFPNRPEDNRI